MGVTSESVRFAVDPQAGDQGERVGDTPPFRIIILSNFSGRRTAGTAWKATKPVTVDRDNIEQVLAKIRPRIELATGSEDGPITLEFKELDDFGPDRIYERVPLFEKLKEARGRLTRPAQESPPSSESGNVLDMILGAAQERGVVQSRPTSPIEAFFREVGEAHAVRAEDSVSKALTSGVSDALGRFMSSILHHPEFQALESAWRSLDRLTKKLDTDKTLTISILDVSKEELAADFSSASGLKQSSLYQQLVDPTVGKLGGQTWTVIVGDYAFGPTQEDVVLLGYLGMIAQATGAPLLAGADPKILGCSAIDESPEPRSWDRDRNEDGQAAFDALRTLPIAKWIGLALPRIIARLPYSRSDRPIEAFEFDEFMEGTKPAHEHFLWSNPAYVLAELLARSFRMDEWEMKPGSQTELLDLPVYVDKSDGDAEVLPCAEVIFTQVAVQEILDHGLMPMLSYRSRDVVRVARFQSIANPAQGLAGRWG